MEIYNPNQLKYYAHKTILQDGYGLDMDRYIYSMQGEGLGSFFGNIFRGAIPILGKAIKGAVKITKPHIIAAGKDLITTGAKRGVQELSKRSGKRRSTTKVIRRAYKRPKWKSL